MKMNLAVIAAFAALVGTASPVAAFDTPTHDEITRRVTDACGYDRASGDLLNLGNRYADYWDPNSHGGEGQVPAAHADEERFPEVSQRIRRLLQQATCQLLACQREKALESIGRTMHPVEDFFSHSNLIEIQLHEGRRYDVDFLNLPAPKPGVTCDPKTHLANYAGLDGLTSDYFNAADLFWKPPGKCSHREINKDHPVPDTTDTADPAYSAALHPLAKARAIEDGTHFLRDEAEPKIMGALVKAFVGSGRDTVRGACVDGRDGLMFSGRFVADVVRADLLEYLHHGGSCPFASDAHGTAGYNTQACPNIDW